MHQHRRISPPGSPRSVPARTDNSRQEGTQASSSPSGGGNNMRGLGIEKQQEEAEDPFAKGVDLLNRIVQNFFAKAALTILHTRVDLPPALSKDTNEPRVNKWFDIEIDETDVLKDFLSTWRSCHFIDKRPPPMIVETFLDTRQLSSNQSLVIIDEDGKRWDVAEALSALPARSSKSSRHDSRDSRSVVVLERWKIELGQGPLSPDNLPTELPEHSSYVYRQIRSLFRSTWSYSLLMPLHKFMKRRPKGPSSNVLRPCYHVFPAVGSWAAPTDNLTAPLYKSSRNPVETYSFEPVESPAGPFSISVTFRPNCEFRVDDSETLLSSRFMGADDRLFKPSLASESTVRAAAGGGGGQEVGSVPIDKGYDTLSDLGQAYGSMSTFHHVGPPTGTSPISALRAARDRGASPNSPSQVPGSPKYGPSTRPSERPKDTSGAAQRRPSLSFQPFKAPPLSASPVPSSSHSRNVSEPPKPTSADKAMAPPSVAASASRRRQDQAGQESALASTSGSPQQAPASKYSSSFSHRRGRLSSGGTSKADEDNNSSGRVSASSSTAQPGSGILAEAGGGAGTGGGGPTTTSGSWHADDEHISDFLKTLDSRKDLFSPRNTSAADANTRRTAAALTRFHKMKDTNAALSDSMSSSTLLQKSSTSSSRQLPNVPPMIPPTSMSTSSSPGKAMSPHTPHTPAIPSRLSSHSIVDYSHDSDGSRRRASRQSRESPVEEASSETTVEPAVSNSSAIDIPTSPPFIPDFHRASSAAQRRRGSCPEDELGDFCYSTRRMRLRGEDRSSLNLGALLRQEEMDNNNNTPSSSRQQPQDAQQSTTAPRSTSEATPESQSRPQSSSTSHSLPYQPRFPHPQGRGSVRRSPSRGSVSSSLGRGGNISSTTPRDRDRDGDRELGTGTAAANEGRDNSNVPFSAPPREPVRRTSRFSRPPSTFTMTFDEDEPLLFAMSDFGSSRRSLEEGVRIPTVPGPRGREAPASPEKYDEDGDPVGGRNAPRGGYRGWQ